MDLIDPSYQLFRDGRETVIRTKNRADLLSESGVICLNPGADAQERMYEKRFVQKRIYFPGQRKLAIKENLSLPYTLIFGINGYSSLSEEKCRKYGVVPGAYEKACSVAIELMDEHVCARYPDANLCYAHGGSHLCVDRVTIETAERLRRAQLGFSCPEYLWYVHDDKHPIYVSPNKRSYSRAFVRSCDVLIAMNGRKQAYEMDFMGTLEFSKVLIPINILRLISTTGGPPALDENGNIEDAVAHFEQRIFTVGRQLIGGTIARDAWPDAINDLRQIVSHVCRRILPPDVGLEIHGQVLTH